MNKNIERFTATSIKILTIAAMVLSVFSLIFVCLPNNLLLPWFTKLAYIFIDKDRIAGAVDRLPQELSHIIAQLKSLLLFSSGMIIAWGLLWNYIFRKSLAQPTGKEIAPQQYAYFPARIIVFLTPIALILRLVNFNQSFWFDELNRSFLTLGFIESISKIILSGVHVFYSIVGRVFLLFFGRHEWAFRLPALILSIVSIWSLPRLSRILKERSIVVISIILFVFSPAQINFSQQAKGYTALMFFTILSSYAFFRIIEEDSKNLWRIYTVSSILGLWTHTYMGMVTISQIVTILLGLFVFKGDDKTHVPLIDFKTANKFFLSITLSFACVFFLYLPSLPELISYTLRDYPRQNLDLNFAISLFDMLGCPGGNIYVSISYIFLFFLGIIFMWRKNKIFCLFTLNLLFIPLLLAKLTKPIYLYERFFIFVLPFYLIFSAAGIYGIVTGARFKKPIFIYGVIVALLVAANFSPLFDILTKPQQDYRAAAGFIKEIAKADRDTVIVAPGVAGAEVSFYLNDYRVVRVKTLPEVKKVLSDYAKPVFFITYHSTIDKAILGFIEKNYKPAAFYLSRSTIAIYK